jgi:ubiquinone/menaquinone biosynthesis C-methylase UbiE
MKHVTLLLLLAMLALARPTFAQESGTEKSASPDAPPALQEYQGRQIAQTMHWLGAEWLIRNEREREERCSLMLTSLGVKPGMTVCDMGCGNGFYTLQLAKMVGEKGRVYAVDIQPEMLKLLQQRADKAGLKNIVPVQGELWDPKLPPGKIDLILLVDVYHEFSHPVQMLAGMRAALAPGGNAVLVEYRGEDPEVPIKPLHKMTKDQIKMEWLPNGFKLAKEFDKLPWQHMMWFEKDEPK